MGNRAPLATPNLAGSPACTTGEDAAAEEEATRPALGRPRSTDDPTDEAKGCGSCERTPIGAFRIEGAVPAEEGGLLNKHWSDAMETGRKGMRSVLWGIELLESAEWLLGSSNRTRERGSEERARWRWIEACTRARSSLSELNFALRTSIFRLSLLGKTEFIGDQTF